MCLQVPNCVGLEGKRKGKDEDTFREAELIFSMFALKEGESKPTPKTKPEREEEPSKRQNIKNKNKYAGTYGC